MKHILLIDGNSIGFAAQSSAKLSAGGMPTQAIFGVLRTIRSMLDDYTTATPIVFWDGRSWRYDHFADYKAGRDDDPKAAAERAEYRKQKPMIVRALVTLGVRQRLVENLEADDVIALTVARLAGKVPATIVSGDRDLLQLVGPNVDWLNPIRLPGGREPTLKRVCEHDFAEQTGYEDAWAFVQGKALLGDKSDNLDGIDGIGKMSAPLVVHHWGSVANAIKDLRARGADAVPAHLSRFRKRLLTFAGDVDAIARFKRNVALMHLDPARFPDAQKARSIDGCFDADAFAQICEELSFASILRDGRWTTPFERVASNKSKAAA